MTYPEWFKGTAYGEQYSLVVTVDPDRVPSLIGKMQKEVQPAAGRVYVDTVDPGFEKGTFVTCEVHVAEESYDQRNEVALAEYQFLGEFFLEKVAGKITEITFGDYAPDPREDLSFPLPESDEVLMSVFKSNSTSNPSLFFNVLVGNRL